MDLGVSSLSLHHLRLPLRQPWRTAYGVEHWVETLLIRITDGQRAVWVESCPLARPLYLPEWAAGAGLLASQVLGPLVLRQAPGTPEAVAPLLAGIRGNEFAKAAIEFAYWGLAAAQAGLPLRERLLASPLLTDCPPAPPGPADLPPAVVPFGEGLGRDDDLPRLLTRLNAWSPQAAAA